MKSTKIKLRQISAIFLCTLMLFGLFPAFVSAEGALTTNKTSYMVNEPIYVTATEGKWVGVYKKGETPSASVLCFYRFDVDGETHNVYDTTNGGRVPSSIPNTVSADVILFGDEGYSNILQKITITFSKTLEESVLAVNSVNLAGQDIYVTATSNERDAWVGVYEGTYDEATYTVDTPAIETFFVANNSNKGKTLETSLEPGDYYLVLVKRKGTSSPAVYERVSSMDPVSFKVVSADNVLVTDKTEYYADSSVLVTTMAYSEGGWVGLYEKGAGYDPENGGVLPIYKYALTEQQPQEQDILKGTAIRPEDYKIGEYTVVMFGNEGYDNVLATTDYSVTGEVEPALSTDKDSYRMNEPLLVSAKGGAWVGVYKKGETPSDEILCFYRFDVDGETHNIYKETNGGRVPATLPSTLNYADVILFGDEGYDNILKRVTVAITGGRDPTVLSAEEEYEYGDDIFVTAFSNKRDAWVGVYKGVYDARSFSVDTPAIEQFFVATYDNVGKTLETTLEPGYYYRVMFARSGQSNPPKYVLDTTVQVVSFEVTYKDTPSRLWIDHGDQPGVSYKANEPVMVTATSRHSTAWVGLYDYLKPDGSDVDLENGYYYKFLIHDYDEPVNIFETEKGPNTAEIKAGKYKVIIFVKDGEFAIDLEAAQTENSRYIFSFTINEMYGAPVWTWNEDGTATATFTSVNSDGVKVVDATVTEEEVTAATCTATGTKKLTATVTVDFDTVDGETEYTNETTRTIPAAGHTWSDWTVTKEAKCEEAGEKSRTCSRCGEKETEVIAALGHDWGEPTYYWSDDYSEVTATRQCKNNTDEFQFETVKTTSEETEPTCTEAGSITYTAKFEFEWCKTQTKTVEGKPATGHNWGEWKQIKAPTCTEKGTEERECSVCHEKETRDVDALDHNWNPWIFDGEDVKTHTHVCANDPSHKETEPCEFDEGVTVDGVTTYTCKVCGGTYSVKEEGPVTPEISGITRVYGGNRFGTSFAISDTILANSGKEKHDVVILANGDNFADALAGSYLAAVKGAPIIITRPAKVSEVNAYIKSVLAKGGTIYVLGGTAAIPESSLKGLEGFTIKRLAGNNRYLTNIEILKEAGVDGDTILIATGTNYADSLSASATGLPMLLVKGTDKLNDDQIKFLKDNLNKKFIILGGETAVSRSIESELKKYGSSVSRIAGDNRFHTSKLIAETFFDKAASAVLAYGSDFPDGLCGGPLANQIGAPLILTRNDKADIARPYTKERNITDGYALGGTTVLPDATVRKLFGAGSNVPIKEIKK